jgi:PKD repeat protein
MSDGSLGSKKAGRLAVSILLLSLLLAPTAAFAAPVVHAAPARAPPSAASPAPVHPASLASRIASLTRGAHSDAHLVAARGIHPGAAMPQRPSGTASTSVAAGDGMLQLKEARASLAARASAHAAQPRPNYNETYYGFQLANASPSPPATTGASLAWDAVDRVVVDFGGYNASTGTYENQTWYYRDGSWVNWTDPADAPPARYGAAFSFDDQNFTDVLFGGYGLDGYLNDTWWFESGIWYNMTASAGRPPALYGASMVNWDDNDAPNGTLLFGGCGGYLCLGVSNATWIYQVNVYCGSLTPCWLYYASVPSSPAPRAEASMVFLNYSFATGADWVILYGGVSFSTVFNDTWIWANNTWANATNLLQGLSSDYPNQGLYGANFFVDPTGYGTLYLYGGFNVTGVAQVNLFGLVAWSLDWYYPGATAIPYPYLSGLAEADSVDGLPPVFWSGVNATGAISHSTYVWGEPTLITSVNVAPATVDAGVPVNFYSNSTGGTNPGYIPLTANWTFGDGTSVASGNASHTYASAGVYTAELRVWDRLGVTAAWSVKVTVLDFTVSGAANRTSTDAGLPLSFTATPHNGLPAYNYSWSFSDGGVAWGAIVPHTFTTPGPAWANVTARDSSGGSTTASVPVTIHGALGGSAGASAAAVDTGATLRWNATASGGTSPYNYTWLLPGGHKAYGASVPWTASGSGSQHATVYINDSVGSSVVRSASVTVNPALNGTISSSSTTPKTGATVYFNASVTGGTAPITYTWHFGDGSSGATAATTHAYSATGTYTVTCWANDSAGGSQKWTLTLTVAANGGGPSPSGSGTSSFPYLWIGVAIVVVAILAGAAIAMSRRRRGSAPPSGPAANGPPPGAGAPPPPPGAT